MILDRQGFSSYIGVTRKQEQKVAYRRSWILCVPIQENPVQNAPLQNHADRLEEPAEEDRLADIEARMRTALGAMGGRTAASGRVEARTGSQRAGIPQRLDRSTQQAKPSIVNRQTENGRPHDTNALLHVERGLRQRSDRLLSEARLAADDLRARLDAEQAARSELERVCLEHENSARVLRARVEDAETRLAASEAMAARLGGELALRAPSRTANVTKRPSRAAAATKAAARSMQVAI